ncbi:hypothetical protein ACWGCI_13700 [Streptomyces sp. NPDC054949]
MSLITEYSTTARPDRRIVEVHDSDAYLGDDEAWQRARTRSGRDAAAAYYDTCLQRAVEEQWSAEQIGAAWRMCPAAEQYTLDLWFVRESEPEDDDWSEGDPPA